jgi:two-component system, chemotaxis family, sensor kinase CheA
MAEKNADLEEIWALVAQEGSENLALVEEALLNLETNPANHGEVAGLFRALHTFKGAMRMMGLANTEILAHGAEDLVALVRDKGVTLDSEIITMLLHVLDRLRAALEHITAHRTDVLPAQVAELAAKLHAMVHRKESPETASEVSEPLVSVEAALQLTPMEAVVELPETVLPVKLAGEPEPPAAALAPVDSDEAEPVVQGLIFEPLALTSDPEYVRMFLEMAREEFGRLHTALERLIAGPSETAADSLQQVHGAAESLQIAAERMGYARLVSGLAQVLALVSSAETEPTTPPGTELRRLEQILLDELEYLQPAEVVAIPAPETKPTNLANLFRQWSARLVEADLERLEAVITALDQEIKQLATGGAQKQMELTEELTGLLRRIYHTCVFYQLDQAAHLTLALEDLSTRLQQDEIPVSATMLGVFRTYATQLREAIQAVAAGHTPDLQAFEALARLAQQVVYLAPGSPVLQVARAVMDALDLAPAFLEVLTPENLADISHALQANQYFYTVLADLDQDENVGMAFLQWTQSGTITPLTNITIYHEKHSLFNFLVTSSQAPQAIREALKEIDPRGEYLTLVECVLNQGLDPAQPPARPTRGKAAHHGSPLAEAGVGVTTAALAEVTETVGELVADQSTLHRVVARLAETEPVEGVLQRVKSAVATQVGSLAADRWESLRHDLEIYWGNWTQTISALAQTEAKLSATLSSLQEKARALGLRPAAELLEPLHRTAQVLSLSLGKQVTLDWEGAELELDRLSVETLAEPLNQLICYCVAESLELPEQRRTAGKPVTGRVTITVSRTVNHAVVVVEDDGRGQVAGLDLAALQARLRVRQGRLVAAHQPGQGSRFTLTLPLDLTVVDGMVVRIGEVRYVVPVHAIQRIVQPAKADLVEATADGVGRLLQVEGRVLPVRSLLAQIPQPASGAGQSPRLLVIVDKEPQAIALEVDELIGRQSVLVRPLPDHLAEIRSASGCALLGEGEVGMVLNLEVL